MSDTQTPDFLKDFAELLGEDGLKTSNVWYHGTASGLMESIKKDGLKRSGDSELKALEKQTMTTIGGSYKEAKEPLYLTQSKELAYFWGQQKARIRNVRTGGEETPVVIKVTLDETLNPQVKPDVGAAGMIIAGSDKYLDHLALVYKDNGKTLPTIDPLKADRNIYLTQLGLAYINKDIRNPIIEVLEG